MLSFNLSTCRYLAPIHSFSIRLEVVNLCGKRLFCSDVHTNIRHRALFQVDRLSSSLRNDMRIALLTVEQLLFLKEALAMSLICLLHRLTSSIQFTHSVTDCYRPTSKRQTNRKFPWPKTLRLCLGFLLWDCERLSCRRWMKKLIPSPCNSWNIYG